MKSTLPLQFFVAGRPISPLNLLPVLVIILLQACSSTGRYQQHKDTIPSRKPTVAEMQNPVPRAEPYSRGGNRNYTVLGRDYQVLQNVKGFKERGIASFYGEKFHGHLTSNGEIYNMYAMTAAHKNLPLPSYVKVTNLNNQKTAIVRVNDRGPFHPGRIIDLSYSAAYKLGITGTAPVEIEVIENFSQETQASNTTVTPLQPEAPIKAISSAGTTVNNPIAVMPEITPKSSNNTMNNSEVAHYIQVVGTSNQAAAEKVANTLESLYQHPAIVTTENNWHKVFLGPINNPIKRAEILTNLRSSGYDTAFSKEMFQQ